MQESDLLISRHDDIYSVKVAGRANFEYAVPLRELAQKLEKFKCFRVDLAECVSMDSTFMGVLSMIGLKARRVKANVELYNANDTLKKLLHGLGVSKLFQYIDGADPDAPAEWTKASRDQSPLTTAQTITEAHQTLVTADSSNAARFDQVIKLAQEDVERLKKESK